jgi:ABC-type glycerol-3-phosphate transport system permease component
MFIFAFTMFFSGGIIPLFLIVRGLGLYDTFGAMILPVALSVWNLIIARTFFQSTIPKELLDSAKVDGCTDFRFFWSIVIPLSTAIIAVLLIFYAVGHWNRFFQALMFLRSRERFPLQLILREILIQNQFTEEMIVDDASADMAAMLGESIKYGIIIVASVPVLILYPWVQKHYVRGIMIGAIKG